MLKAIVISLLLIISTGKLSCKAVLCLQENFQGHTASGESSECATVVYNLFAGLVEVFKNNLPFMFTLLFCYVAFVVLPALIFTLYLFSNYETPHQKPLPGQKSNEGLSYNSNNTNTTTTNNNNNHQDDPQTELNPLLATSPQDSGPARSKSKTRISNHANKTTAYSLNLPHEEQQRAVAQPNGPLAVQQVNECDSQNEESPEISIIESPDGVTLLRNLGSEICNESTPRKTCVIAISGILLAIVIYRLVRK